MFPGTSPAFMNPFRYTQWDVPSKAPDVIITGNGKVIDKTTPGPGGARGNQPRVKV